MAESRNYPLRDRNTGIHNGEAIVGCNTFICVPTAIGWFTAMTCSYCASIDITKL